MQKARKKRRTVREFGPDPIDVHVGGRVRLLRTLLGMSQEELAVLLDLSFQQIQKNETGFNRISATRLYQLCHIFGVQVGYFFEGIGEEDSSTPPDPMMFRRETLALVRAYESIRDRTLREAVFTITKAMAKRVEDR